MEIAELLVDGHYKYFLQIPDYSAIKQVFLEDLGFNRPILVLSQVHLEQALPFKQILLFRLRGQVRTQPD